MPYNLIIPSISLIFNTFPLSILPFCRCDYVLFFLPRRSGAYRKRLKIFFKIKSSNENRPISMACGEFSHQIVLIYSKNDFHSC